MSDFIPQMKGTRGVGTCNILVREIRFECASPWVKQSILALERYSGIFGWYACPYSQAGRKRRCVQIEVSLAWVYLVDQLAVLIDRVLETSFQPCSLNEHGCGRGMGNRQSTPDLVLIDRVWPRTHHYGYHSLPECTNHERSQDDEDRKSVKSCLKAARQRVWPTRAW